MPHRIQVTTLNEQLKDKIIDHGVDLLNEHELSTSQQRELQRYIDANRHLLGVFDKPREEKSVDPREKTPNNYANALNRLSQASFGSGYDSSHADSINRINSPYSEYGTGKRKEVSWYDGVRARSHSPSRTDGLPPSKSFESIPPPTYSSLNRPSKSEESKPVEWPKPYVRHPDENSNSGSTGSKPWYSASYLKDRENSPAYSSLQRHPDDYNRFETRKYIVRETQKSRVEDPAKFYGFGDHANSGIEIVHNKWTGGERVTDPNILKKSLKPRRFYYSPIGDGVVNADGVELKHGPKDMSHRLHIRHEKLVEGGDRGHDGVKITEKLWDEFPDGNGRDNNGRNGNGFPDEFPRDASNFSDRFPLRDDSSLRNRDNSADPYGSGQYPLSGRSSALSNGSSRSGWTKTFIVNPRELINQYANETNTNIFDLEDHTPKTMTTTKQIVVNDLVDE